MSWVRYGSIRTCECCDRPADWVTAWTLGGPGDEHRQREYLCDLCYKGLGESNE